MNPTQNTSTTTKQTGRGKLPVVNPDGSDKNFGGFDEDGRPINQTTEKFPGNESHPGNKPNYPELHKTATDKAAGDDEESDEDGSSNNMSSQKGGEVSSGGGDSSQNVAEVDDMEEEGRRGDNPLNEKFSTNRGHKPPGDESIANRGSSDGEINKDK